MGKKWWITPLTLALLVLAVLAAAAVIRWVTPRDYEQPYPDEGVYYCEQLDLRFTFAYRNISVTYPDGTSDVLHADWGGGFVSENYDRMLVASSRWKKEKDLFEIKFRDLPLAYDPDTKYIFVRIG